MCLAALYESWSIPFSVMLVVPLGVIGALLAATFRGLTNDVYFQVGLLTTIGLSAKNAILIVEFAKDLMDKEGKGLIEATLDAVRMRLRPILMTSLAFILGVMPLVISTGAGSGAQKRGRCRCNGRDGDRNGTGNLLRSGILCGGSPPL
ncbi:efflux RND transporter permease subunit [Escherichia coli]|nr:efflux RND transporter permease subunit [Escherichia coli]